MPYEAPTGLENPLLEAVAELSPSWVAALPSLIHCSASALVVEADDGPVRPGQGGDDKPTRAPSNTSDPASAVPSARLFFGWADDRSPYCWQRLWKVFRLRPSRWAARH